VRLAVPKGRMAGGVEALLREAGIELRAASRDYRPSIGLDGFEAKVLKPQAIVEMLASGTRDVGFAGADWVVEHEADVVELLDTGLDPVRLVAAAPSAFVRDGRLRTDRSLRIATEYLALARRWVNRTGLDATLVRSYGATEVLPPEDADCIVDNTASGATLVANGLTIVDELMRSSTRLYASRAAMADAGKRGAIEELAMLCQSVLEARSRVMIEVNVDAARLESLVEALPCMREPTVAPMHGASGFAVKAAVPREELARVVPELRRRGGTDIIVTTPDQIVR
jgi:ATP phosphoribosyltransferase